MSFFKKSFKCKLFHEKVVIIILLKYDVCGLNNPKKLKEIFYLFIIIRKMQNQIVKLNYLIRYLNLVFLNSKFYFSTLTPSKVHI